MTDVRSNDTMERRIDDAGDDSVMQPGQTAIILESIDGETRALIRLAALLASGSEAEMRVALTQANGVVRATWVEEVILQTYLFAGFPRALNAAREWRRISGLRAPSSDESSQFDTNVWTARGEATCATVYGEFYDPLRVNIRGLHPALDAWMIVDGYGKVLGRPMLDLARRELCVVATCAVARQDRQLHSHLHGAINAGASAAAVSESLALVADLLSSEDLRRYQGLWARVQGK
jgi:4-carboxymuconolactone decarboxylase